MWPILFAPLLLTDTFLLEEEAELELDVEVEVEVFVVLAEVTVNPVNEPAASTPAAPTGVTELSSPALEFCHPDCPSTCTVESKFQPLDVISG